MSMTHHRRRYAVVVALFALVALLGTACGADKEGADLAPSPTAELTTTEPTAAPTRGVAPAVSPLSSPLVSPLSPTPTPAPPPAAQGLPSGLPTLAYVRKGDVWLQPLDGMSDDLRLTRGGGYSLPRWSASRRWIAYMKEGRLTVADPADGRVETEIDAVSAFAWSPVGDRLATVTASGIQRLAVLDLETGEEMVLVPPEEGAEGTLGAIAWSPDGAWVAYEWKGVTVYQGLWRVPAEGGEPVELYASAADQGEALLAGWTADSSQLLFWQGPMLSASALADGVPVYALPVEGGEPVQLADAVLYRMGTVVPNPIYSGRAVLVDGSGRGSWTQKQLRVAGMTGQATTVTDASVAALWPAWSPDGERLAYVGMPHTGDLVGGDAARDGMMERHIWTVDADGTVVRQLTRDPVFRDEAPRWSPDGTHILFARLNEDGDASLWLVNSVEGEPVRVAHDVGPLPGPGEDGWFGNYGYITWGELFDW